MKNLKLTEEKKYNHPLAMSGWILWSHLEYMDEKCYSVVTAVFLLSLFPAVVATKYLADYHVFLKG